MEDFIKDSGASDYPLEVQGMSKVYDNFQLTDISFKIPQGSIVGIIGENGAGKSTTFKAALDIVHRDEGQISFWGKSLEEDTRGTKSRIGVVLDNSGFYELLSPKKIGNICQKAYPNWDMHVYEFYLQRFELPKERKLKNFSKGMRVKLNLAVALSHNADLLILDEPTSGLDPIMRDEILDIFLDFVQDEKHSIVISSHITTDLEKIADYIIFIHKGQLVLEASKDELIYDYGIIRCGAGDFGKIAREDILAYRDTGHQMDVLIKDKSLMARRYKGLLIDDAKIDDIMMMYVKGTVSERGI